MLPKSFAGLIIGKPGSGKSKLIEKLLLNPHALKKKFDLVLFMAPYEIADLKIPESRMNQLLDINWVIETVETFKIEKDVENCLVVIDDLISSIHKDASNQQVIDFMYNRRKLIPGVEMSILCTTQKYTLFPARFRSCLQFIIFFQIPPDDFKTLQSQQIYKAPNHLTHIIDNHFRKYNHNFIYLRLDKLGIFLNFSKHIC